MELAGKQALVLGLGVSGLSMARWLASRGAHVRVADTRATPPCAPQLVRDLPAVRVAIGPWREDIFAGIDLIALSPGIPAGEPSIAAAAARGVPVVGDIELFAQALPALGPVKVLAITGSNGKSTVTEMTGAMCRAAGLATVVAGNIGLPVLDVLLDIERRPQEPRPEAFVLELSSFQLETTSGLDAQVAVCLNLSEDHLDRYDNMRDYAQAKARIFRGSGVQVLNRQDAFSRAMALPGRRVLTFGLDAPASERDWGLLEGDGATWLAQGDRRLMSVCQLRVTGLHNAANALAALALGRAVDLPYEPLLRALAQFEGLPHRVQKIAQLGGVVFFDDSKGTNVGATVAALNGMRQRVVLIAGGDGKGQDFGPLQAAVAGRARAVVLIGRDRERIAETLTGAGVPLLRAADMEEAVRLAFSQARDGDAVLLSPACASFDMFRNYEHRAQAFAEAVRKLDHSIPA
ncbi:MAG TPA: UDP-N-acetylmuramoyl-L-alanine--D-glutamate ligase [Burkholderiales bacterium]|nr:UDP-N-acetylmuramoyl-L-alanine--D-glutamate ligase [Burkholderiales bacterium]